MRLFRWLTLAKLGRNPVSLGKYRKAQERNYISLTKSTRGATKKTIVTTALTTIRMTTTACHSLTTSITATTTSTTTTTFVYALYDVDVDWQEEDEAW